MSLSKKFNQIQKRDLLVLGLFLIFLYFVVEFFYSFNWNQKHLLESNFFDVGRRHYTDHLENYLNLNIKKINTHVVLAFIMLVSGALQFSSKIRIKAPRVHRTIGYTYYLFGFAAVGIGIYLSDKTRGGITAQISNYITGFLWLYASIFALTSIVRKQIKKHQFWSYRSFYVGASTGLIRPIEFIVDKGFPHQSSDLLFGLASWLSLVCALLLWASVTETNYKS